MLGVMNSLGLLVLYPLRANKASVCYYILQLPLVQLRRRAWRSGGAAGPAYNIGGLHLARAGGGCAVRDWRVPSPVALTDAAYKVCPPPPRPADSSSGMPAECARVVGGEVGVV